MKFLLFLFVILLSAGAAKGKSPLSMKLIELATVENPQAPFDKSRVSCLATICRFEDKENCKSDCAEWAEIFDPTKGTLNTTSEDECKKTCPVGTSDVAKAEKVCGSICHHLFSYPKMNEWLIELTEAIAEAKRKQ